MSGKNNKQGFGSSLWGLPDPVLDIIVSMLDNSAKAHLRLCSQAGRRAVSRTLTRARVRGAELGDFMARGWPDTLTCLLLVGEALPSLPASLGQLAALQTLHLYDCEGLTSLPAALGQLSALQTLDMSWCEALPSLPASLGQLSALRTLHLSCCTALTSLPAWLGQLPALHIIIP
jgi:hypothetical protein